LAEGLRLEWCRNLGRMVSNRVIRKVRLSLAAGRTRRGREQKRLVPYTKLCGWI
jgi:hypothetical protein